MTIVVQLEKLSKSFEEGGRLRPVLAEVTAAFVEGEFVVVLGRSGSGKSTLLNLISGIEKPTAGNVTINGVPITRLRERERTLFRRDHIGFVFQFFNLIPTLTVLENVTLPQELAGRSGRQVEAAAMDLLARVGLADRRDTFPDKLSGGEQQRVAIARALAHDPMLVLADEPTGNLDEETGQAVLALLLNLTRDAGKTLIMATHSPEIVPLADRVFRIHDGNLVETVVTVEATGGTPAGSGQVGQHFDELSTVPAAGEADMPVPGPRSPVPSLRACPEAGPESSKEGSPVRGTDGEHSP